MVVLSTLADGTRNASTKKGGDYDEKYSRDSCGRSNVYCFGSNGHVDRLEHIALLSPTARA